MLSELLDTAAPVAAAIGALAALAWGWKRLRKRPTRPRARPGGVGKGWRELEPLVADAFRLQGYQIIQGTRERPRADGEIELRKDRETYLVQCREWGSGRVGVEVVHALHRSMSAQGAAGGFVLTEGRFSREAVAYADTCNVRLIGGEALAVLVARAKATRPVSH